MRNNKYETTICNVRLLQISIILWKCTWVYPTLFISFYSFQITCLMKPCSQFPKVILRENASKSIFVWKPLILSPISHSLQQNVWKFEKLLISSKLSHTQIHNKTRDTETGSLTFGNDVLKDQKIESNGLIGQNVLFFYYFFVSRGFLGKEKIKFFNY